MPDIAAANVTYTISEKALKQESGHKQQNVTVAFGNGTLTYPAGGVPLLGPSMGMPNAVLAVDIIDAANGNGFLYKYDKTNNKIRIYQGDNANVAAAPAVELAGGSATPAAATLVLKVLGY